MFLMGMTKEGFFLGVMSVTFLGPGNGLSKKRGVFQKGGGILCFEVFFLCDITRQACSQLKTFTELFFTNGH